jgi:hypothetical protein
MTFMKQWKIPYNVNDRDNTYTVKLTSDPVLTYSGILQFMSASSSPPLGAAV